MEFNTSPSWMENDPRFEGGINAYDKRLDAVYDEKLKIEAQREGSIVIKLSEIPEDREEETLRFLDNKLMDYTERFERRLERFPTEMSVEAVVSMTSAHYKRTALRILLERGEVNTWALSNSLNSVDGSVIPHTFENALGVIHDYVKTFGKNVKQG